MGYYDGLAGISAKASAYDVAKITKTPAVLIVNAKGMSLSAAAFIKGFVEYQEDSQIRGVILNQVSSMMYPRLKQIIEEELSIKVYGYVPVVKDCVLESRHLGLVMPEEIVDLQQKLMELAEILEKSVDIDGLLELAEHAEELPVQESPVAYHTGRKIRIALAKDEAFCFFIRIIWNFWKRWEQNWFHFLRSTIKNCRNILMGCSFTEDTRNCMQKN